MAVCVRRVGVIVNPVLYQHVTFYLCYQTESGQPDSQPRRDTLWFRAARFWSESNCFLIVLQKPNPIERKGHRVIHAGSSAGPV